MMMPHGPKYLIKEPAGRSVSPVFSIALLAMLLLTAAGAKAQKDDGIESVYTKTAALAVNATALMDYNDPGEVPYSEYEASKKITNVIRLKINEETTTYIPDDFTASVTVNIKYGDDAASAADRSQTLSVSYSKNEGTKYNAANYFSFEGAAYVKITVTSVNANQTASGFNPATVLVLENSMIIRRYYELSSITSQLQPLALSHSGPNAGADELPVSWNWPAEAGNTHTQLEWTWLEDEVSGSYRDANGDIDAELVFAAGATRIDLARNVTSYAIPLLYGSQGRLYFRIRAVNIKKEGFRKDGPWSPPQWEAFSGHNSDLNWQSSISYAEEGKRKVVVQYFDGLLRSRQTVTKDNSTNTTIIAETLYDLQGRPAVQVLPSPGINEVIGYTRDLNRFNNQPLNSNPAFIFDVQDPANNAAPAMTTLSGASQYYSPSNPASTHEKDKYIPDAEGYPYALTRYTPDASGRVMAQSGVGPSLKLGSGHETKYYYGTPSQEELDALFGTEVGIHSHYFKNMVKDANGQMSVSYADMHGRTIATALAGSAPSNLTPLNLADYPGQSGNVITEDLLAGGGNVKKNSSIESISTLLVPATSVYTFRYELSPDKLQLAGCDEQASFCYDCMYDLEIVVSDESGATAPLVKKYNNVKADADDDCATAVAPLKDENGTDLAGGVLSFSTTLFPGSYIVRKTLTVSEASLEHYRALYMENSVCKTEQELADSIYQVMEAASACAVPVPETCQACKDALGDYNSYKAAYLSTSPGTPEAEILTAYSDAEARCDRLCGNTSQLLATKRQLMLMDMMPYSGQYARATGSGSIYDAYNIFSTVGSNRPYYQHPQGGSYLDPFGKVDQSIEYPVSLSADEFESVFSSSWAEQLLPYHPEYPRLVYAEDHLKDSYDWITSFLQTDTYAAAGSAGYLFTSSTNLNDPFFVLDGTDKNAMAAKINSSYAGNLSLWQIAYGQVKCSDMPGKLQRQQCYESAPKTVPFAGLTSDEEKDRVWNSFKTLYANERDNYVNKFIAAQAPLANSQAFIDQGYILRFPQDQRQMADQLDAQDGGNWSWYPATDGGPVQTGNMPTTSAEDEYTDRCSGYIDRWRQELEQCPAIADHPQKEDILNAITTGMQQVCLKGSDANNPYGSSSVAPGTPQDGSPRTFEEVVYQVMHEYGISTTDLCNPYVIEFPKPYNKNPEFTAAYISSVDTCNCGNLARLKQEATGAGYNAGSLPSFNQYLFSAYGDTLTSALFAAMEKNCPLLGTNGCVDSTVVKTVDCQAPLDCNCDLTIGPSPDSCYVSCTVRVCATADSIFALAEPQPLPGFLKCGYTGGQGCLSCAAMSALVQEFKDSLPAPFDQAPYFDGGELDSAKNARNILFARFLNYRTGYDYTWADYVQSASAAGCDLSAYASNGGALQNVICGAALPLNDTTGFTTAVGPCDRIKEMAAQMAAQIYQARKDSLLQQFDGMYLDKCMAVRDSFTVTDTVKLYHFTLYYYDMAGNLVKTVPPKGVRPDYSAVFLASVKAQRPAGGSATPSHVLETQYRYNSLNAVVAQNTPDAGVSEFWYDALGRLVVSRNAQQAAVGHYSYTIYDELGRITEVGQKPQSTVMSQAISQDAQQLASWILTTGGVREQITRTGYDLPFGQSTDYPNGILYDEELVQRNLRSRVSYSEVWNYASDTYPASATYYTYDVHGNVDALLQDYGNSGGVANVMNQSGNRFKKIVYDYDLVSGKVNEVIYQPDYYSSDVGAWVKPTDQFIHRYSYDAENRITAVDVSTDGICWEKNVAQYEYYRHGPLAKATIGSQQVQSIQYAYSLQGWMKGVVPVNDANTSVARQAFNYNLNYFSGDYQGIGASPFVDVSSVSGFTSLYNGNIAAMLVDILQVGGKELHIYRYDQLNRIKEVNNFTNYNPGTNTWQSTDAHKEQLSFDPNGNIGSALLNGDNSQLSYESFSYSYDATKQNRLLSISNSVNSATYNFDYDQAGNITKDELEGNSLIEWTVYGKVKHITKTDGTTIDYSYDASGNKISEVVSTGGVVKTTWYVRDASGNTMATYVKESDVNSNHLTLQASYMYGSQMLGRWKQMKDVEASSSQSTPKTLERGEEEFYFSNHLGNNLLVLSDRKLQHSTDGSTIDYYNADVLSATDYSAYGESLIGREFNGSSIKYGFNGKENDQDAGYQDYGMRMYSVKERRFLSVDPLAKKYPFYTPYQFAGNMPISAIDLDGLEPTEPGSKKGDYQVAKKEGTEDYYGWTWTFIKNRRRNHGFWQQGSSTMYQNGDIANTSSHDDNTKTYHPEVQVRTNSGPQIGMVPVSNQDNDLSARYNDFVNSFTVGKRLSFESNAANEEAESLVSHFVEGSGTTKPFSTSSNMARLLAADPAFKRLSQSFEEQALSFYREKGTLEGFNGTKVLEKLGMPYIKDTWFMHTVMGGTQQWNAQIRQISASEIRVRYTVWDRFGAGTDDAQSKLPGLPSLYWLQHNSAHYYPSTSKKYAPFTWNISVER